MRLMLCFIIITSNIILNAQELRVGVIAQPGLSYFTVQSEFQTAAQNFRQQIKPILAFQGGILLFKKISPNVSLVTGLLLVQRGVQSQYNTSNISAFNFSNTNNDVKVMDRSIEIPVLFHFYLKRNATVSWFASGGLKPSFYLNSVSKTIGSSQSNSSYYYSGHRKLNLYASLGFGAEIQASDRIDIVVWPSIDHALISELYASPVKLYPYSAGVNLCLVYSLGN